MYNTNPLLLIDFYKATHAEQYPKGITKVVSYFTPRMSRINDENSLIMFGLQGFIKEYLIDMFNKEFFNKRKSVVINEYKRLINNTLGEGIVNYTKIEQLYDLGYLPIEIKAIAEGTQVPIKVPMFEISNTHDDFAWLVNTLETALSCSLWHTMISANIGYRYRKIVNRYYDMTVDANIPKSKAVGDFSMRGQESIESAIKSSAGFALSFLNTATLPMIMYLEKYYNVNSGKDDIAYGLTSTEHSVMCSNYAVDGDEVTLIKRLLTETYPKHSFNIVSDSYDYWNLIDNVLPICRNEIENHNGFLGVRGDSGSPVDITVETVERLWNIFGGTINSKGYKVLNPKIKAVYGDSITPQRLEQIYQRLANKGFASNNVSLASGSFSLQCLEDGDRLNPFTRDTFGIAIKATYCEVDGKQFPIFKNPKTDTDNFKKSQKGCCIVFKDTDGKLNYVDELSFKDTYDEKNLLTTVFKDSIMVKEYSLKEIRYNLHKGGF